MKRTITFSFFILLLSIPMFGISQNKNNYDYDKNVIKFNLTGLLLNNYGIQYERMISRKTSFALGLRTMPESNIPFANQLGLDSEDFNSNDLTMGNYAITPEIRFYLGKKSGPRGFYFAPFFRYSNFDFALKNINFSFEDDDDFVSIEKSASISANVKAMSAGAMIGSQWRLGKAIYLDWWISGGSYGKSNGNLSINTSIDKDDISIIREDLQEQLNDIEISSVKTTLDVTEQGARVDFKAPWASVRAGLSLGFRF
jgi:hypothetical protein